LSFSTIVVVVVVVDPKTIRISPSLFSGLCSVFRSRGGDPDAIAGALEAFAGNDSEAPAAFQDADPLVDDSPEAQKHNAHWATPSDGLDRAPPPRHVAYYDAASLYPSSGEAPLLKKKSPEGLGRLPADSADPRGADGPKVARPRTGGAEAIVEGDRRSAPRPRPRDLGAAPR